MYKYQLNRLFRKLGIFLICALIIIALSKVFVVKFAYPLNNISANGMAELDTICEETTDFTPDERLNFINKWQAEYSEKFFAISDPTAKQQADFDAKEEARSEYQNQLRNCAYTLEGVKNYIKTGIGFVSGAYPLDLAENPKAYVYLATPQSINENYFTRFLSLQGYNICPFIILLLVGIFVADSYEKRIDLQVKISARGQIFAKSREVVLCIFTFALSLLNLVCDLVVSGLIFHSEYLSAPIQSVQNYIFFPANITIGGMIFVLFIMQTLGLFIGYNVFILLSQGLRSMRNYLITSAAFVGIFSILPHFFPTVSLYCFMGMNNKDFAISGVKYISAIGGTNLFVTFVILLIMLSGVSCWRFCGFYGGKNAA